MTDVDAGDLIRRFNTAWNDWYVNEEPEAETGLVCAIGEAGDALIRELAACRERIRALEDALRAALEAVPDPNVIPCECSCSEGECYCARIRKQCLSALTAPASDGEVE